jgi:hypothetical protein
MRMINPIRERRADYLGLNESLDGTGVLQPEHNAVIKNADWFPTAGTYQHYRMLVVAASQPDVSQGASPAGPTADHPFSVGYSEADQEIINRTAKLCGYEVRKLSDYKSREPKTNHTASPVNHNSGRHR